ncbi:MAG: hypothetical protein EAZ34_10035 [Polaromonas sp.]|nr:MAG: hypothetical protein EAZ34_10035 [Polaromonas sp.]
MFDLFDLYGEFDQTFRCYLLFFKNMYLTLFVNIEWSTAQPIDVNQRAQESQGIGQDLTQ